MKQTLDNVVGTRWNIQQIMGLWKADQIKVEEVDKHKLPDEVLNNAAKAWEERLRQVGNEIGKESEDWRIVDAEPYNKLEVRKDGSWKLRMFAGPQTRIEDYQLSEKGILMLKHSLTNYAESLATNNTDPYGLIRKFGRDGLADGHAVSVAIIGKDYDTGKKVIQYFKRGEGLGEYGSYFGSAAGNSKTPDKSPFDIARNESMEESGIIPKVLDKELHYFGSTAGNSGTPNKSPFDIARKESMDESGIISKVLDKESYNKMSLPNPEFQVVEKFKEFSKVRYLNRKGKEEYGIIVDDDPFMMIGLALNIDPDDKDKEGKRKPHHKSEYLFIADTNIPIQILDDEKFGWRRNDEHAEVMYVPLSENDLIDFAMEYTPGSKQNKIMPPTHALTLGVLRNFFGEKAFNKGFEAVNSTNKFDFLDNPIYSLVEKGYYELPKLMIK